MVHDGYGIAQHGECGRVEAYRSQRSGRDVYQVTAADILRVAATVDQGLRCPVLKSSTAICAASGLSLAIVNNTPRPFGSMNGNQWSPSPLAASGVVNTFGCPPDAGTLSKPVAGSLSAKTTVSFGPQCAPRSDAPAIWHSTNGGTSGDGRFLELRSSGEPNPLSIRRKKRPVSPDRVRERSRLGPIERPHQQLPLRRASGPVNDVSAIRRDVDVRIDAVERQRLLG